jgi:hypothetical protein
VTKIGSSCNGFMNDVCEDVWQSKVTGSDTIGEIGS